MDKAGAYLTVASMLSGFGITALVFRVGRELQIRDERVVQSWISWADYLVLCAIFLSLILVVVPLMIVADPEKWYPEAAASCAAASVLLAVYPFAILAHYRIPILRWRSGTAWEKLIVTGATAVAIYLFVRIAGPALF